MRDIFAKKDKRTEVEKARDEAMLRFRSLPYGSQEREKQLEECDRLQAMAVSEKQIAKQLDPNAILGVVGQTIGIGQVLNYEKARNVTSKALQFVMKGRVR